MARAAKAKRKDISVHSRAARRATEPSAEVTASDAAVNDKDTRSKALEATYRNDYAGITKKTSKRMSRQQRLRKEKGMERQEQNEDKLLKKVADSYDRAKRVKGRNANWEDLNSTIAKLISKPQPAKEAADDEWEAADSIEDLQQGSMVPAVLSPQAVSATPVKSADVSSERPVEIDEVM